MKKFILFSVLFLVIAVTFGSIYFLLPEILTEDQKNSQVDNKISSEEAQLRKLEQGDNTMTEINKNLQGIEISDSDKEFTTIDNDIKNL